MGTVGSAKKWFAQRVDRKDPVPSFATPRRHPHSPAGSEPSRPPPPLPPPWFSDASFPPSGVSIARDSPDLAPPSCCTSSLAERTSQSLALILTLSPVWRTCDWSEVKDLGPLPPQQILLAEVGKTPLTWALYIQRTGKTPPNRESRLATGMTAAPPRHASASARGGVASAGGRG